MSGVGRLTYEACAAAGLSQSQCARVLGVTPAAVSGYAKRHGLTFADGRSDPEFAAKRAARMKALHADPEFATKRDARGRALMKALNADPECAAKRRAALSGPLAHLTPAEPADYDVLRKKGGLTRDAALAAVGRADLGSA